MSSTARNVLILVAIAAAVAFLPGGGESASFVGSLLSTAIIAAIVMIGVRSYRENRVTIFSLGDRHRGYLYGALAGFVVLMAGRERLLDDAGGAGVAVFVAGLLACGYLLYEVYRHYREYAL